MKHYLIFAGGRGGHSVVYLARAPSLLGAIQRYLSEENSDLTLQADGSVMLHYGRKPILHPHALAYVEALDKVRREWQIRELPESVWEMEWTEGIFCGESEWSLDFHMGQCRPLLRQEFPRSRAPAFLWYLKEGTLVTFYHKVRPFQIEVLRRYLVGKVGYERPEITPWTGGYDDLLEQIFLLRPDWAAAVEASA